MLNNYTKFEGYMSMNCISNVTSAKIINSIITRVFNELRPRCYSQVHMHVK